MIVRVPDPDIYIRFDDMNGITRHGAVKITTDGDVSKFTHI